MKTCTDESLFNIGEIVLYCWRPGYSCWRKGKIVSNNFAMMNLPDFFGKPEYYISELDENDHVIDDQKSVAIDKDSKYLVRFKKGMEWCIGKHSSNIPRVRDFNKEKIEEKQNLRPFDKILICIENVWYLDFFVCYLDDSKTSINTMINGNIFGIENWEVFDSWREDENNPYGMVKELLNLDKDFVQQDTICLTDILRNPSYLKISEEEYNKNINVLKGDFEKSIDEEVDRKGKAESENWKNMAKHLSYADMINASPALKKIAETEDERYKKLNDKLDKIIEMLNTLQLEIPRVYPTYPWTTTPSPIPCTPWYEKSPEITCDDNTHVYNAHLNWDKNYPYEKYTSTYGDPKFDEFCKKYNDMSTTNKSPNFKSKS